MSTRSRAIGLRRGVKRCDSCERVAILARELHGLCKFEFEDQHYKTILSALDAHDRARLAAPEMVDRVARAIERVQRNAKPEHYPTYEDLARAALAAITEAK